MAWLTKEMGIERRIALASFVLAAGALAVFLAVSIPSADAATITSAGPVLRIELGTDTKCQVFTSYPNSNGFTHGEYYSGVPGACATFVEVGNVLYGPPGIPAGGGASPLTPWTLVSQTPVTGAGTVSSPFEVVTTVAAGSTGIRMEQLDTYIVGESAYTTTMTVINTGTSAQTIQLWRAADCYVNGSDASYGFLDVAASEVACTVGNTQSNPSAGGGNVKTNQRLILWHTTTTSPAPSFIESSYGTAWARVGAKLQFPNTCVCTMYQDSGLGISWQATLPPAGTLVACIENIFQVNTIIGCAPPTPPTPPTADFVWSQPDPCYATIQFVDLSTIYPGGNDTLVTWSWDFGDGTTGSGANPSHVYPGPGPWTATLTVTDDDGETDSLSIVVTLCVPPVPQFSYVLVSPCDTHDPYLQFIDESYDPDADGGIVDVWWNFGDGGYSYEPTPYHTYGDEPGTYQVTITAMDNFGTMASATLPVAFPGFVACALAAGSSDEMGSGPAEPQDGVNDDVAGEDADEDGIAAGFDNCAGLANPDQLDFDGDGFGDLCDHDADGDGRANDGDNCVFTVNGDQTDVDGDGLGDACETDADGDGVPDGLDVCPGLPDPVGESSRGGCGIDTAGDTKEPLAGTPQLARGEGQGDVPVATAAPKSTLGWILLVGALAALVAVVGVVALRKA